MIGLDVFLRFPEDRHQVLADRSHGLVDLLLGHAEILQIRSVKFFREAAHRFIAVGSDILQNRRRCLFHISGQIHRPVRQPADLPQRQSLFRHLYPFHL